MLIVSLCSARYHKGQAIDDDDDNEIYDSGIGGDDEDPDIDLLCQALKGLALPAPVKVSTPVGELAQSVLTRYFCPDCVLFSFSSRCCRLYHPSHDDD